ncbi:MAG: hypothetical protein RMI80_11485 [Meiothermus sp.]|uniref:hypothetical protein n=1 Tax=Meiothermus sp. TaxID=1955249 RepID=UPI00298F37A4|nr:hypothetical protein [Meiothermus sp.]MDW8092023.1 hypothetical protein [Meiothermus sp.]
MARPERQRRPAGERPAGKRQGAGAAALQRPSVRQGSRPEGLQAQLWFRETLRPRLLRALLERAPLPEDRLADWIEEGLARQQLRGRGWKGWRGCGPALAPRPAPASP